MQNSKAPFPIEILKCTQCDHAPLAMVSNELSCEKCKAKISVRDGKIFHISSQEAAVTDGLDRFKSLLKRFNRVYRFLVVTISPVYPRATLLINQFIRKNIRGKSVVALNLGSGTSDFGREVYNVDIMNYKNVDLVSKLDQLPIRDQSVDIAMNVAVLEHLPDPISAIGEMHRILKPGGRLICYIPFIVGFHACPYDFQRYTYEGMKYQFREFEINELRAVGVTSGMLWVFQEWLAMVLSLGIAPLYRILHLVIMSLTWPIKFLDAILDYHPHAKNISSGFYIECTKRGK